MKHIQHKQVWRFLSWDHLCPSSKNRMFLTTAQWHESDNLCSPLQVLHLLISTTPWSHRHPALSHNTESFIEVDTVMFGQTHSLLNLMSRSCTEVDSAYRHSLNRGVDLDRLQAATESQHALLPTDCRPPSGCGSFCWHRFLCWYFWAVRTSWKLSDLRLHSRTSVQL